MQAEAALGQVTPATAIAAQPNEPGERPLWQVALAAWLGQRLLIGALVVAWQLLLQSFSPAAFYRVWTLFDGIFYSLIAQYGYRILQEAAYFPLYPLLMHVAAPLVGGHVTLAGLLLANLLSYAAFLLLGKLVAAEFGPKIARRTLLYYAVFPTGLFLAAVYTEALFLLLSVAAFFALRQRRWLLCGALIALATLTRAPGALLLLPLAIEAWRALRPDWPTLTGAQRLRVRLALAGAVALPLLAFFAFQLYLTRVYGISDALSRAAANSDWLRWPDWPWAGVVNDATALAGPNPPTLEIYKDVVFLAFWLGLCIIMLLPRARRIIPLSWVAYSWASLLQVLALPAHIRGGGLMSVPRYVLVVFPCFALLALIGVRYPRAHRLTVALCIAWTIILTRLLAGATFVA